METTSAVRSQSTGWLYALRNWGELTLEAKLHYVLRLAVAMCFIGHGAFGFITKKVWTNYFGVVGIPSDWAYSLMPVVGLMDVGFGIITLLSPRRFFVLWLVGWGMWTALLRPMSGEPFWETIERAGNYGVPLALMLLYGFGTNIRTWFFERLEPGIQIDRDTLKTIATTLQWTTVLLLAGHGALNLMQKGGLLEHYARIPFLPGDSLGTVAQALGAFELLLAAAIAFRPLMPLLIFAILWKMGTETLYTAYPVWEWIERGGSYGAPLALWLILKSGRLAETPRA